MNISCISSRAGIVKSCSSDGVQVEKYCKDNCGCFQVVLSQDFWTVPYNPVFSLEYLLLIIKLVSFYVIFNNCV